MKDSTPQGLQRQIDRLRNTVCCNDRLTFSTEEDDYELGLADAFDTIVMDSASANTITVPLYADVPFKNGTEILIIQEGAGQTSIAPAVGVTINSFGGALNLAGQYAAATLIKKDTNIWYLIGNITT